MKDQRELEGGCIDLKNCLFLLKKKIVFFMGKIEFFTWEYEIPTVVVKLQNEIQSN